MEQFTIFKKVLFSFWIKVKKKKNLYPMNWEIVE